MGEKLLVVAHVDSDDLEALEQSGLEVIDHATVGNKLAIAALHNTVTAQLNPPKGLSAEQMENLNRAGR